MVHFLNALDKVFSDAYADQSIEKVAAYFAERQEDLEDAPSHAFAVVVFDNRQVSKKFPIKTAEDVLMSIEMLNRTRDVLPEEIVKVAEAHLDGAHRMFFKKPAFRDVSPIYSNIVPSSKIDKTAFANRVMADKLAKISPEAKIGHFVIENESAFRKAEHMFDMGMDQTQEERAEMGVALVKRAYALGIPIKSHKLSRFDRGVLPGNFYDQIEKRAAAAGEQWRNYFEELKKEASTASDIDDILNIAKCVNLLDGYTRIFNGHVKQAGYLIQAFDMVYPNDEEVGEEKEASATVLSKKAEDIFGSEFAELFSMDPNRALDMLSPTERQAFNSINE